MKFTNQTQEVIECVRKIEEGKGYATMWFNLTPKEKECAEVICQYNSLTERRVQVLRAVEILFSPIQDVIEEEEGYR